MLPYQKNVSHSLEVQNLLVKNTQIVSVNSEEIYSVSESVKTVVPVIQKVLEAEVS